MPYLSKLAGRLSLFWASCWLFWALATRSAVAIGPWFESWQNLSSGPLSLELWESIKGDVSAWQVEEGRLQARLQAPSIHPSPISAVAPSQILWPVSGNYQFSFDYTPLDNADKNIAILFNNELDGRGKPKLDFLSFHFINGNLHVENFVGNFSSHRALVPFTLIAGQTYRAKIIYRRPDFTFYLDDELLFSSFDDHGFWPDFPKPGRPLFYISRGIFLSSAADFSRFDLDYFPQLAVPYFSQLDPLWADEVYDHMTDFGLDESIGDWGCVLSSAAMILNYYAYTDLFGVALTPKTLNDWLKTQIDGYIGQGLVNWLAISRLSAELSRLEPDLKRPILEFSYQPFSTTIIKEQLTASQPIIADVGEHFVVITGEKDEEVANSYLINDPLAADNNFQDHYSAVESLRLFQPSRTDLSYYLLLSDSPLNFTLKDEQENILAPQIVSSNLLGGRSSWLYYWPKPKSKFSKWCFDKPAQALHANPQLFIYDQLGQVKKFELDLNDIEKSSCWQLNVATGKFNLITDFSTDFNKTWLIYQQKIYQYLLNLQKQQEQLALPANVARYQTLIEQFLNFYQL